MKEIVIVLLLAFSILIAGCAQKPVEKPIVPFAPFQFSLAITDNAGEEKNGVPLLNLKFEGTPGATTIIAKQGTPTIDGKDGDAAWGPPSKVSLAPYNGGGGPSEATVKAAYDSGSVYFLVKWKDPTQTESIHKKMWIYDAATGKWSQSGNEDRVFFLFNINAADFGVGGCTALCHVGDPKWDRVESKMGANNPGEKVDVWHWKAARSNPLGIADDKYWTDITTGKEIIYEGEKMVRTRLGDSGPGFYSGNKEGALPKYMHKNDPGANVDFLLQTDAVDFNPKAAWKDGDTIPGYVLKKAAESRADVITAATYSDGTWVVEFQRSLITGNPDDAQFK